MTMAEKIYNLRKQQEMTLEEVAAIVGVGKSTVRKWEIGAIANMRRDKIAKLAEALNTTPAYLMGWEDEPYMHHVPAELSLRGLDPESDEYKSRVEKLSQYGLDLDEYALSASHRLTSNEQSLLTLFRKMPPDIQEAYLHRLEDSLKNLGLV